MSEAPARSLSKAASLLAVHRCSNADSACSASLTPAAMVTEVVPAAPKMGKGGCCRNGKLGSAL